MQQPLRSLKFPTLDSTPSIILSKDLEQNT
jgi:hypothetical protein